ncbi:hypothetical protein [Nonomuraea sp. SBT364]|uniref:hypothetical protein n=1 Tax=Nonomuraea sp. SBT364 TaxID=1580530 RepID=UPI00066B59EE|nr:hypothetical protein [Nonomuraea sp. SBT364]
MRPLTRITPSAPAGAFQTYRIISPPDRAVRSACEEVGCLAWLHGWETRVDERTDLGSAQALYIRADSGRTFRELRTAEGLTVFRFEPRQRCFAEHRTRPEFYSVRGGDWRQDFGTLRQHQRGQDWVEDFSLHQDRLADHQRKG